MVLIVRSEWRGWGCAHGGDAGGSWETSQANSPGGFLPRDWGSSPASASTFDAHRWILLVLWGPPMGLKQHFASSPLPLSCLQLEPATLGGRGLPALQVATCFYLQIPELMKRVLKGLRVVLTPFPAPHQNPGFIGQTPPSACLTWPQQEPSLHRPGATQAINRAWETGFPWSHPPRGPVVGALNEQMTWALRCYWHHILEEDQPQGSQS